jgi:uncharacterized protein YecT (DUF1311 family)
MEIPENVFSAMRAGDMAYRKLVSLKMAQKAWTKEQDAELSLLFEIMSNTHNALKRFIDANTTE